MAININLLVLDPVETEISREDVKHVYDFFKYTHNYWQEGKYRMERKQYERACFTYQGKDVFRFYTGLIPKLKEWCEKKNITVTVKQDEINIPHNDKPSLPPFGEFEDFEQDQKTLMEIALTKKRGCIKAPTGIGKTAIELGLFSCFPNSNLLLLCHTKGIIQQTAKIIKDLGWGEPQIIGAGNKISRPNKRIVLATIQSFAKLPVDSYIDYFDVVIVDEAHRVSGFDTLYCKVLSKIIAPYRWGFSATYPDDEEAVLCYEGLLGGIIGEVKIKEAMSLGRIAKSHVIIVKLPMQYNIREQKKWDMVEELGIIYNQTRHSKTIEIVEHVVNLDQTVLILVNKKQHGWFLQEKFFNTFKEELPFVTGEVPNTERQKIKARLISKEVPFCMATNAWREGIDIPNLNNIIIAGGGKDEIPVLQGIGRGFRRTWEKDSFTIWDFFDPSHYYLVSHFGERFSLYCEEGLIPTF